MACHAGAPLLPGRVWKFVCSAPFRLGVSTCLSRGFKADDSTMSTPLRPQECRHCCTPTRTVEGRLVSSKVPTDNIDEIHCFHSLSPLLDMKIAPSTDFLNPTKLFAFVGRFKEITRHPEEPAGDDTDHGGSAACDSAEHVGLEEEGESVARCSCNACDLDAADEPGRCRGAGGADGGPRLDAEPWGVAGARNYEARPDAPRAALGEAIEIFTAAMVRRRTSTSPWMTRARLRRRTTRARMTRTMMRTRRRASATLRRSRS